MSSRQIEDRMLTALVPVWNAAEATRVLAPTGRFTFGSDTSCDVPIPLDGVADHHCSIVCHNGTTTVLPCPGASVQVNGQPLKSHGTVTAGDVLSLGPAVFQVDVRRMDSVSPQAPQPVAPRPQPQASSRHSQSERERRVLDERHQQLMQWQEQLENRCVELDRRTGQLAGKHTQLLHRQRDFETRSADFDVHQQDIFSQLDAQRELSARNTTQENHLKSLTAGLTRREAELEELKNQLEERESSVALKAQAERATQQQWEDERLRAEARLEQDWQTLKAQQAESSEQFRVLREIADDVERQKEDHETSNSPLKK